MDREIKFRAWKDGEMLHWNRHVKRAFKTLLGNSVLMQYTGLKDKNGREIYEGDIIETSEGQIELVEWDDNERYACFYPFMPIFSTGLDYTEVIGNKFENPELLEEIR